MVVQDQNVACRGVLFGQIGKDRYTDRMSHLGAVNKQPCASASFVSMTYSVDRRGSQGVPGTFLRAPKGPSPARGRTHDTRAIY